MVLCVILLFQIYINIGTWKVESQKANFFDLFYCWLFSTFIIFWSEVTDSSLRISYKKVEISAKTLDFDFFDFLWCSPPWTYQYIDI